MKPIDYTYLVFTVFWDELDSVKQALLNMENILVPDEYECNKDKLDIASIYVDEPQPGFQWAHVVLFRSAAFPVTVFVANVQDGLSSWIYVASSSLQKPVCSVKLSLHASEYPMNMFVVRNMAGEERVVYAMRDSSRWEFYESGPRLPFEDIEKYQRRRKRERLTAEMIIDYLRAMGVDIRNERFWETEESAVYIRQLGKPNIPMRCTSN